MQFMVFAVNMPAHEPHVGQMTSSISLSSSSDIIPAARFPTASKMLLRSMSLPPIVPASIGPPLIITVGMFSESAAIAIPGMILSQLVTSTRASRACARTITSMESMISSLLGSENFIPSWFMAIPSQTPMTGNSSGKPPKA